MRHSFLITIDVEDWFQVENLRPWNPPAAWGSRELRVERNVHRLLDLFDSFKLPSLPASQPRCFFQPDPVNPVNPVGLSIPAPCSVRREPFIRATFFVLGWLAARLPHLVREIAARGHEVASHGSSHRMCRPLSDADLGDELQGSKRLIEDITGAEVAGFRAPNFSVDDRVLSLAREAGYRYDSSYNSFSLHGRYGKITLNGPPRAGIAYEINDDFFELPVSNLHLGNLIGARCTVNGARRTRQLVLPWSGGAYFRFMPLGVFQRGVRAILDRDGAYVFYMHPWEIDPEQPRVGQASPVARFKHYTNLDKTMSKLRGMMEAFTDCRFAGCGEYIGDGARCTAERNENPAGPAFTG